MKLLLLFALFVGTSYACKDKWSDWCARSINWCSRDPKVKRDCPKTCGVCGPTQGPTTQGPCQDMWASWCSISKSHCSNPIVHKDCPVTCGLCGTRKPVTFPPFTQLPGSCGLRQVSSSKVIAGKDAKRGDWPWQILLKRDAYGICGGTIIDKRYVVTAAHCVASVPYAQHYSVVVGETDTYKDEGSEITIKAEKIIVNPRYSRYTMDSDIALIKLKSDIPFSKYVQPICLPSADINPGHHECYITGWGVVRHPGYMYSMLQQARMPPVANDVCQKYNRRYISNVVTKTMLCAGEGGINQKSGCQGDSGGPYVCEVNGNWELHGAVSYGSRTCDARETYTVFARVHYFKQWIINTMRRNGV